MSYMNLTDQFRTSVIRETKDVDITPEFVKSLGYEPHAEYVLMLDRHRDMSERKIAAAVFRKYRKAMAVVST